MRTGRSDAHNFAMLLHYDVKKIDASKLCADGCGLQRVRADARWSWNDHPNVYRKQRSAISGKYLIA